jgi:hypothetical protein
MVKTKTKTKKTGIWKRREGEGGGTQRSGEFSWSNTAGGAKVERSAPAPLQFQGRKQHAPFGPAVKGKGGEKMVRKETVTGRDGEGKGKERH